MPCVVILLLMGLPRAALLGIFLFSDYLGQAYATNFWPVLGFLFMPLTTLAWAWAMNTYGALEGLGMAAVIVAGLADLGLIPFFGKKRE